MKPTMWRQFVSQRPDGADYYILQAKDRRGVVYNLLDSVVWLPHAECACEVCVSAGDEATAALVARRGETRNEYWEED